MKTLTLTPSTLAYSLVRLVPETPTETFLLRALIAERLPMFEKKGISARVGDQYENWLDESGDAEERLFAEGWFPVLYSEDITDPWHPFAKRSMMFWACVTERTGLLDVTADQWLSVWWEMGPTEGHPDGQSNLLPSLPIDPIFEFNHAAT